MDWIQNPHSMDWLGSLAIIHTTVDWISSMDWIHNLVDWVQNPLSMDWLASLAPIHNWLALPPAPDS
jgi:hypothetical protein